jgi:hypothetical protein
MKLTELVPGREYTSPSGRPCLLLPSPDRGPDRANLLFKYLDEDGENAGFSIRSDNEAALARFSRPGARWAP